jgi:hypothetical protein
MVCGGGQGGMDGFQDCVSFFVFFLRFFSHPLSLSLSLSFFFFFFPCSFGFVLGSTLVGDRGS